MAVKTKTRSLVDATEQAEASLTEASYILGDLASYQKSLAAQFRKVHDAIDAATDERSGKFRPSKLNRTSVVEVAGEMFDIVGTLQELAVEFQGWVDGLENEIQAMRECVG